MTAARIEASRGAGAALDTATQTHMENALGHNFAEVRVHADREADALSRAVGALAFTTGSDIYFRDDAYGPDSPAGRRLMAHELTHVVQQRGMRAAGPITVGPAASSYEQQAESTAASLGYGISGGAGCTPAATQVSRFIPDASSDVANASGTQSGDARALGISAPGDQGARGAAQVEAGAEQPGGTKIPIQNDFWAKGSFVEMSAQSGLHVFHTPATRNRADIPERVENHRFTIPPGADDPAVEPFKVGSGSRGHLISVVEMKWKLQATSFAHDIPVIGKLGELATKADTGDAIIEIRTGFDAKSDAIKFRQPRAIRADANGGGASLSLPVTPSVDTSDTGGTLIVPVSLLLQGTTAFAGQTPATPLGLPVAQAQQQVNVNTTITRSFSTDLEIDPGAKPPDPKPDPNPQPGPTPTKNTKFFQYEVHFRVDSDKVDDPEYLKLRDWFHGKRRGVGSGADAITPEAQGSISDGKTVVHVFGQASNTGSPTHNQALSERRAKNVERFLQDFAGSDAKFNLTADGPVENGSTNEDPEARRVLVFFDAEVSGGPTPPVRPDLIDSPTAE